MRKLMQSIEEVAPDKILLLGDLLYHGPRNALPEGYDPMAVAAMLNSLAPSIIAVRGNCDSEVDQMVLDFPCRADYAIVQEGDVTLFLTHGHLAGMAPDDASCVPESAILVSGHTHVKGVQKRDGRTFANPGSTSIPKDGVASYAIFDGAFSFFDMDGTPLG